MLSLIGKYRCCLGRLLRLIAVGVGMNSLLLGLNVLLDNQTISPSLHQLISGLETVQAMNIITQSIYLPIIKGLQSSAGADYAVVFVSRQIPANGSIYWNVPKDMP